MKSLATTIFVCCSFSIRTCCLVLYTFFTRYTQVIFVRLTIQFYWFKSVFILAVLALPVCGVGSYRLRMMCHRVFLWQYGERWGIQWITCFAPSGERLGFQFFDSIAFPMFPSSFSKLFLINHLCLRFVEKKNSKGDKSCRSCLSYLCSEFHIVTL